MGLSGGFGNLTMGRIWSASENNAGGWRFLNPWHGSSDTTGRISNAVSYSFSSEMASFQIDAVMGPQDTGNTVDELGFGATINLGDIGRLGFAHRKVEDTLMTTMVKSGDVPKPEAPKPEAPTPPADDGMMSKYKTNAGTVTLYSDQAGTAPVSHNPAGTLQIVRYVYKDSDGNTTDLELYKVPSGQTYYSFDSPSTAITDGKINSDKLGVITGGTTEYSTTMPEKIADADKDSVSVSVDPGESSQGLIVISGKTYVDGEYEIVTRTMTDNNGKPTHTRYIKVSAGNQYYLTKDVGAVRKAGSEYKLASAQECNAECAGAEGMDGVMIDPVPVGDAGGGDAGDGDAGGGDGDAGGGDAGGMTTKTEVDTPGHTENHITLQVNLGAMTGTLGYSEIDNNDEEMDKKITFVGLNGAIGDTGMSWTVFSRNVDEHDGSDTNSWGASLSKSLGTGTSVYIDYGDDGDDGTTFAGLSVSF